MWDTHTQSIIHVHAIHIHTLPSWLSGKKPTCQCRWHGFDPWVVNIPCRRKWQSTPVFLTGKSHGQRSQMDYSPWGHKRVRYNCVTKQQQMCTYYASIYICVHILDICIGVCVCVCIHTHIYTHIHTYMHTHTQWNVIQSLKNSKKEIMLLATTWVDLEGLKLSAKWNKLDREGQIEFVIVTYGVTYITYVWKQ